MFWLAVFSIVVNEELVFPSRKSNYIEWIQSSLSYQIHLVRGSENFPDDLRISNTLTTALLHYVPKNAVYNVL